MLKPAAAALLLSALAATASPATASLAAGTAGLDAGHLQLIDALHAAGVSVQIGHSHGICATALGAYLSLDRLVVVCTDEASGVDAESLDTLRHEAIHVAQDCRGGGGIGDLALKEGRTMADSDDLARRAGLDLDLALDPYVRYGDGMEVLQLEAEAFSAAAAWGAEQVIDHLNNSCRFATPDSVAATPGWNPQAGSAETMPQILRINFKSGRRAERIGDDETVVALFDADSEELIDCVMAQDSETGACAIFAREDDDRWEPVEFITFQFGD